MFSSCSFSDTSRFKLTPATNKSRELESDSTETRRGFEELEGETSFQEFPISTLTRSSRQNGRPIKLTDFPRESPSLDPRFVTYNNTIAEVQVGATAILHCKTSSSTGGLVSWIRKRDYQLLTVGLQSHSSDERFSINYVHWDWQLHIRYVQPRDAGAYECQVSSHPPASIFVHLDVVEAEAEILGSPEKHVKSGSILRLVCILHHTTEAPAYVFWYRGSQMINYNEEQSVVVESDEHTSVLLVAKASRRHSGNYTCVPSNAKPASILVHILTGENGEYPAAMQHGESEAPKISPILLLYLLPITVYFFLLPTNPFPKPFSPQRTKSIPSKRAEKEGVNSKILEKNNSQKSRAVEKDKNTSGFLRNIRQSKIPFSFHILSVIIRYLRGSFFILFEFFLSAKFRRSNSKLSYDLVDLYEIQNEISSPQFKISFR